MTNRLCLPLRYQVDSLTIVVASTLISADGAVRFTNSTAEIRLMEPPKLYTGALHTPNIWSWESFTSEEPTTPNR